jgi:uncharacterized protein (DUF1697 family)
MPRYAAFLRGMNLGGRRVTNVELRDAFAGLGFAEVDTFRASGNVIFTAPARSREPRLREQIETGLVRALGYEVPTFLRTAEEVRAIAAQQPFASEALRASKGKLQVGMLASAPAAAARRAVLAIADERDRLAFGERELLWLPSGGISESELDLRAVAALLGAMTLRTMATVEQIAARMSSD